MPSLEPCQIPGVITDLRLGNDPRYLVGDGWYLMRVPEEIRKCVCFVGYRMHDGTEMFAGTAFFVARRIDGTDRALSYVVTARHVIDGIRDLGLDQVLLRVNSKAGARWLEYPISEWVMHPEGRSVDVAVLRGFIGNGVDHLTFGLGSSAFAEVIHREDIGVGTEAVIAGLFVNHAGKDRNIPIVRVGNIAAMPEEKVGTTLGPIDAYLIEARSLGGLSGSPVFAHVDPVSPASDGINLRIQAGSNYLLGLVHGHFDEPSTTASYAAAFTEKVNAGIAIVVPVGKIHEVINQPYMRDIEAPIEEQMRTEHLPTPD